MLALLYFFLGIFLIALPRTAAFIPYILLICLFLQSSLNRIKVNHSKDIKNSLPKSIHASLFIFLCLTFSSYLWSVSSADSLERIFKLSIVLMPSLFLLKEFNLDQFITEDKEPHLIISLISIAGLLYLLISANLVNFYETINGMLASDIISSDMNYLNRSMCIYAVLMPIFINSMRHILIKHSKKTHAYLILFAYYLFCTWVLWQSTAETAKIIILLLPVYYLIWLTFRGKYWWAFACIFSLLVILSPFLSTFAFNNFAEIINKNAFLGQGGAHGGDRLEIYNFISNAVFEKPLYGYGLEATKSIDFKSDYLFHNSNQVLHPHNFALQIWLETGLLGVLSFTTFTTLLIRHILLKDTRTSLNFLMFLNFTTMLSFGYGMWQSWCVGFLVIIVAVNVFLAKSDTKNTII